MFKVRVKRIALTSIYVICYVVRMSLRHVQRVYIVETCGVASGASDYALVLISHFK